MRIARIIALLISLPWWTTNVSRAFEVRTVLVKDGRPTAVLVLPDQPQADEELAARELQTHLRKMSGAHLEIVRGEAPEGLLPVRIGLALTPGAEAEVRQRSEPGNWATGSSPSPRTGFGDGEVQPTGNGA